MDGLMDELVDGLMAGMMDGLMDEKMAEKMDGLMDEKMNGLMSKWLVISTPLELFSCFLKLKKIGKMNAIRYFC